MSRTYRCRNLPIHVGRHSSYKIQDGVGRGSWRHRREAAAALVEKELGPRPTERTKIVKGGYHYETQYHPKPKNYPEWLLGPWIAHRSVKLPGHWIRTYEAWYWDKRLGELEDSIVAPVSSWHRYQRHPQVGSRKRYYRILSNRLQRRRAKIVINTVVDWEEWNDHFPHKRETFNWWDIY